MSIAIAVVLLLQATPVPATTAGRAPEILERHCLHCHNEKTHKGDLDLSRREAIQTKPEALWRSVAHLDEPHMPNKAPKLPQADIDEIRRWAEAGMKYERKLQSTAPREEHWAFAPLRKGSLEALAKGHPVDSRTLTRRAVYDVRGLPPTDADFATPYEALVDQLLAGP